MNTTPRRVTWMDDDDLRCAMYAQMGFATKMIMEHTGLSHGQVTYRLHKAGIKRKYYRDGTSDIAQRVIERVMPANGKAIRSLLNITPVTRTQAQR